MAARLLLVDPEPGFRRILREQLEQDGAWRVEETAALAAPGDGPGTPGARPAVDLPALDLIVVTVVDRSTRAAVARHRRAGLTVPVIALVGAGGRDVPGASLTIRKPIRLTALLAAIGQLSGRGSLSGAAPAAESLPVPEGARPLGPYSFDAAAKRLVERGGARTVRLTEKEVAMLDLLWHAAGAVVPRDALLAQVWGYQAGLSTHTLETHVYRLRRKIERDPARAELLVTEVGGYRLAR
jgi:DNA-binding response OmpR family regulator